MNDPLHELLLLLMTVLGGLSVLLVITLVVVRAGIELLEGRSQRKRDELRRLILTVLLDAPAEADVALAELRSRTGRAWRQVERQGFAMLPKIKGDSHTALVALLTSRGASERARANLASRSPVRRSRGAHQLGALGEQDALEELVELLAHPHFLVRRTAVRALGQIRAPEAAGPLLDAVSADSSIARDVVAALQRLGPLAAPRLREDLAVRASGEPGGRRGEIAATVLGLYADVAATPVLVETLGSAEQPALRAAAAEALGKIGVPSAVPALLTALAAGHADLRVAAAVALGRISDLSTAAPLADAFGTGDRALDRAVAEALLNLGPRGWATLEQHSSYYAAEALAVHRVQAAA